MKRELFVKTCGVPVSDVELFGWHENPGALDRLLPAWQRAEIIDRSGGIGDGQTVTLRVGGPLFGFRWSLEHHDHVPGRQFRDRQSAGPFACWDHLHHVTPDGPNRSVLQDRIIYALPLGGLGRWLAGGLVRRRLQRLFTYRHRITRDDLCLHHALGSQQMNIAVTGSTGLIGRCLVPLLSAMGHKVTTLGRSTTPRTDTPYWNPQHVVTDPDWLTDCDAVVHLAGENIAGRWTLSKKARIRDSRVHGTRVLCESLARMARPPTVLVCASAIGIYADRGDETLTEDSRTGTGFLANLCRDWEDATAPVRDRGTRVVHLRFGVVLGSAGGALAQMRTPFRLGLGGPIGDGRQYMSWIAIDDAAGLVAHALATPALRGPVNAVAPNAVTNRQFARTLGRVLHRPAIAPMPAVAARLLFGEMADALLLSSARVIPQRAVDTGYRFRFTDLESALRHTLGR